MSTETNLKIKIPEKLYCGFQKRSETEILGFLTPFGTDKAFEKRKNTVDKWSSSIRSDWEKLEPKVFNNVLIEGFRIDRNIRRFGWYSNNSVIRVEDPRGFELEISIVNLCKLIENNTIVNGEIKAKCIWGRDGARNVLLAENSQPYIDAQQNTERLNRSVSLKDIRPGNVLQLKNGEIITYLGRVYISGISHITTENNNNNNNIDYFGRWNKRISDVSVVPDKPKLVYLYSSVNQWDQKIVLGYSSSLKVSKILDYHVFETEEKRRQEIGQYHFKDTNIQVFFDNTQPRLIQLPLVIKNLEDIKNTDFYMMDLDLDYQPIDDSIVLEHKQTKKLYFARSRIYHRTRIHESRKSRLVFQSLYKIEQADSHSIKFKYPSSNNMESLSLDEALENYNFYGLMLE